MTATPAAPTAGELMVSDKGFVPALLLCFFLGALGVHRFYVGKVGTGILMLLTFGGLGIWAMVDFIMIAVGSFEDKEGRKIKAGAGPRGGAVPIPAPPERPAAGWAQGAAPRRRARPSRSASTSMPSPSTAAKGSPRLASSRGAVRIVKRAGSRRRVTRLQASGMETGAPGRGRTESGAARSFPRPFRR